MSARSRLHRALTIATATALGLALVPAIAHAVPTITTLASPDIPLGGQLSDQATLSGGASTPTGTVTFRLYANDPTCGGLPVFTDSNRPLTSNGPTGGTATSTTFTPAIPGVYRWIATYNGDANNAIVAGLCDDPAETRSVGQSTPVLTSTGGGNTLRGSQIADNVRVTGGLNPTGSVTFRLYGPSDPNCGGEPVYTSTGSLNPVNFDPPLVVSGTYTPTTAGIYRWIARYNGDTLNSAVSSACGDPSHTWTVFGESMATIATPSITLGGQLSDRATVANLFNATAAGTVTFRLYGPDDAACSGTPVYVNVQPLILTGVTTIGIAQSAGFTPETPGVYRWIATYSGDANNAALTGACNDADETSTVAPQPPPKQQQQPTAKPSRPPKCGGKTATIVAVAGVKVITGTAGRDVIVGSARADTIRGRGGNDVICAGRGNDTVRGGAGSDTIRGEGGGDRLYGESGSDVLSGGDGADLLFGGSAQDRLRAAGGGDDRLDCGPGPGLDAAFVDPGDRRRRCEIVRRATGP